MRANPRRCLKDGASMKPIPRNRLIVFRDDQQSEVDWPDSDSERGTCWNHAGKKPGERRHPFKVRVAVVRLGLEEGNSRGTGELDSVVQL